MEKMHKTSVVRVLPVAALLWLAGSHGHGQTLPPGFRDRAVISGLTKPTAVAFASDGRVFVAEKSGLIKVFDNLSDTTPTVFADLRTNVYNSGDRGLLGLALDRGFPTMPYVYVLYTHDAEIGGTAPRWGTASADTDSCPSPPGASGDGCVVSGRLSRLEAAGNTMTGPEQVLIEDWFQQYPSHSIGSLVFGTDGALYVSAGEGASFQFVDYGQDGDPLNPGGDPPVGVGGTQTPPTAEGGALRAQDLRTAGDPTGLGGTILRVDPATGAGMPDNPLAGSADANARRIIAYGLRNPFRIAARPGTPEIWIGDVGWNSYEEINRIADAADVVVENFGWPCYEGTRRQGGYEAAELTLCADLYAESAAATFPEFSYHHNAKIVAGESCSTGSSSVSGLAFYGSGSYPVAYQGALFFADYSRGCVWTAFGASMNNRETFISNAATPAQLLIGPAGDLFYVSVIGGAIHRIQYFEPNAIAAATPTVGPAPLFVAFDATGSTHPNPAETLFFSWDLDGDDIFGDSTLSQPTYTYTTPGTYNPRVRVTDTAGGSDTATVTLIVDNTAPTPIIDAPLSSLTWKVGDTIAFSGSATDPQDGPLPASALHWSLILQHCPSVCHQHPQQEYPGVASGSFTAEDHEYPSYLELRLTATDTLGLQGTASVSILPQTVALTFSSSPAGLQLAFGSESASAPFTRTTIVNSNGSMSAPSPQVLGFTRYYFSSWSDGGAQSHNFVSGADATTYTASFAGALPSPWQSLDIGAPATPGSASFLASAFEIYTRSADIWVKKDQFHYVHQPLSGDGEIVARVVSQTNTWVWAKAGVMIRQSLAANSPHAFMLVTPGSGTAFQYRVTANGNSSNVGGGALAAPYWVKLVRAGNSFTGFQSPNGVTWTQVGSATIAMTGGVYVGLASTTNNVAASGTAVLDNVTVIAGLQNTFPTVSITSPAPGAEFPPGATIGIDASASDTDGTVTQVAFYAGSNLLGTDSTSPYSFAWNGASIATHSLTARATDNSGAVSTSSAVSVVVRPPNNPPSAAITAPAQGDAFTAPATITIQASAVDSDGTVSGVEFYSGSTLLGLDASAPYTFVWSGVAAGDYSLTVRATDNAGATTDSAVVNVSVNNATGSPPAVALTGPADGAVFTAPATITLDATASDSDGTITQVAFYSGSTLLNTDAESPYSFVWNGVGTGTYTLTAKASDDQGWVTSSNPVMVSVQLASSWLNQDIGAVGIAGSAVESGGAITVTASGADIWGTADQFHFVYQPMSGDGEIVARVTSVQNTHPWAKAGVMLRENLTPGSPHAMMAITAGSGIAYQRRPVAAGSSVSTSGGAGTAPTWVKVVRTGSSFYGYRSADGVTWTLVKRVSMTMGGTAYIGLAVTSVNNSATCSATFDNITLTP